MAVVNDKSFQSQTLLCTLRHISSRRICGGKEHINRLSYTFTLYLEKKKPNTKTKL